MISNIPPSTTSQQPNIIAINTASTDLPVYPNTLPISQTQLTHQNACVSNEHKTKNSTDKLPFSTNIKNEIILLSEDYPAEKQTINQRGYFKIRQIGNTLQGSIFVANTVTKNSKYDILKVVIKRASKILHQKGITIQSNKMFRVKENIFKEYKILKYLQSNLKYPTTIIKCIDFFETPYNVYLVMNHGGNNYFDFILKSHQLIQQKMLSIDTWGRYNKFLFYQLASAVNWLHNDVSCCHLDISLENITVENSNFMLMANGEYTINKEIRINICDFGLAEIFYPNKGFTSTKFCGKTSYKAPEVYSRTIFDARKADIWSLGVVLFAMSVGCMPYNQPSNSDAIYKFFIKTGKLTDILILWNKQLYVTLELLDLLKGMMNVDMNQRFSIKDVLESPWLELYYKRYFLKIL